LGNYPQCSYIVATCQRRYKGLRRGQTEPALRRKSRMKKGSGVTDGMLPFPQ
jgi:hypothetical protein